VATTISNSIPYRKAWKVGAKNNWFREQGDAMKALVELTLRKICRQSRKRGKMCKTQNKGKNQGYGGKNSSTIQKKAITKAFIATTLNP